MNPDLQKLQDMLIAMQQQRDQANNGIVVAQAEIATVKRTLAERDSRIKVLETENEKLKAAEVVSNLPSNPYAQESATVQ